MANVSLHQLLGSTTVTKIISQIKTPMDRLQGFFGMGPGGAGTNDVGGIRFGYDIFDRTRLIANGRAPGTGPSDRAPQKVGHVPVSAYRAHEKIHLDESRLFRTRAPGQQWGTIDSRGAKYVAQQERHLAQMFKNNREFMISRMLRGGYDVLMNGDNWLPVDSGAGDFAVDFQIPASNKTNIGGIISASWATAATDILGQIIQLNAKSEEDTGHPIRHAWINSGQWENLLKNTGLQAAAGTANRTFTTWTPTGLQSAEGVGDTGFVATLEGLPWLQWHIYDAGLTVNGSFSKLLKDNTCTFMPDPSTDWTEWYNGSEIVAENVMAPGSERFGLSAWTTRTIDPAGFDLKCLDVGIPVLYLPKAIYHATVEF